MPLILKFITMELDIEYAPIIPTSKTLDTKQPSIPNAFNISRARFYCFIKGYPYIVLVPNAIAITTGINLLTILICSLSMLAIEWTWVTWSLLLIQLLSYNLTSLLNPGTPRNTGNISNNCKLCNAPMTKDSVHCFKCGICIESTLII
jgi:hypothetical protein